jgi:hypothetical protein
LDCLELYLKLCGVFDNRELSNLIVENATLLNQGPAYQTVIHIEGPIPGVAQIVISPDDGHIVPRNMYRIK